MDVQAFFCTFVLAMESICAISTPYGTGGIAVIRISGDDVFDIVAKLIPSYAHRVLIGCSSGAHRVLIGCSSGAQRDVNESEVKDTDKKLSPSTTVQYYKIPDLDDVVVTTFRAPHSFTGENVVEISCHGSLYIQQELLRRLCDAGCRIAKAGEFTERAFINGKMDLAQAEAVADLIAAETKAEKDMALSQLRGGLSSELDTLRERLLHITSLIELELDFADHEELEFADRSELQALAAEIEQHLKRLTNSFSTGNAIKNGIPVAIIGVPNAGKSTLLNALLGENRAIVSAIPGTTRDTVEERLVIDGQLFRLIDTAGIHETEDYVEQLGIERTYEAMDKASILIHVQPQGAPTTLPGKTTLVYHWEDDIEQLKQALVHAAGKQEQNGAVISSARHYEALTRALEAIQRVRKGLADNISGEFLSMDLQDCLSALGEVTGKITNQEVLNNIFSKFCIGK